MKYTIKFIVILFIFWIDNALGQNVDQKQIRTANKFLDYLMNDNKEQCWELFDKTNVSNITKDQFYQSIEVLKSNLSVFDSFELSTYGVKIVDEKQFNFYTFKANSKEKNIVDEVSVDVIFFKSSSLVAGVQPKKRLKETTATTSKAKETLIEKSFTAEIDNIIYKIIGINIVHFENNDGLLAIQVEYILPEDFSKLEELTKKEGVKFAKYLVQKGYLEKATSKASEINLHLLEELGVSFFDPSKGKGYNIMVKAAEYR